MYHLQKKVNYNNKNIRILNLFKLGLNTIHIVNSDIRAIYRKAAEYILIGPSTVGNERLSFKYGENLRDSTILLETLLWEFPTLDNRVTIA